VTAYDVLRATGSGPATVVGTTSGTSFAVTGLAANTTYTFTVRSRDAAGNTSPASPGRTVTTPPGGGGGAGCAAAYRTVNTWAGGFQAEVTISNTGTQNVTGWTATWTLPAGTTFTQMWNGRPSISGTTATVRNESYNGNLGPGASTSFGFTASGSSAEPASVACSSS
jgi:chitodextrinase